MHEIRSAILSGASQAPATPIKAKSRQGHGSSLVSISVRREESRLTNQRREDRLPGVVADAVLAFRRRKYQARVINLSSTGAMLECDLEPRIGEKGTIDLGTGCAGKCVVRWIKGQRIGIEFDGFGLMLGRSETGDFVISPDRKRKESPRPPRESLVWPVSIHANTDVVAAKLKNISAKGALIESPIPVAPGTKVLVDLSGAGMVAGTARWFEDGLVGVQFDREFDIRALSARIRSEAGKEPGKENWLKPEYLQSELDPNSPWAGRWDWLSPADLG